MNADACPECDPFDSPASLPDSRGVYECRAGHRWRTTRDLYGWPVARHAEAAEWPTPRRAAA